MKPDRRPASPGRAALADVIERNIVTMAEVRAAEQARATLQIVRRHPTRFSGNMWFVTFTGGSAGGRPEHGLIGHNRFDPFPFGLLTPIVSLEAIFPPPSC